MEKGPVPPVLFSILQMLIKGLAMNKGYMLLLAPRGAVAGGHLLCCRSSTMAPHHLRRSALHLPARRSRQNATLIHYQALR
jgi:hypothetical protein